MTLNETSNLPSTAMLKSVRAFLRGLGFEEPLLLGRLAQRVAGELKLGEGSSVREALEARMVGWLAPHFEPMPREQLFALARVAFLTAGAAERWPEAFLPSEPKEMPKAMIEALRAALPVPTPVQTICAMPEQSLAPASWIVRLGQLWSPQAQGSWNS